VSALAAPAPAPPAASHAARAPQHAGATAAAPPTPASHAARAPQLAAAAAAAGHQCCLCKHIAPQKEDAWEWHISGAEQEHHEHQLCGGAAAARACTRAQLRLFQVSAAAAAGTALAD